MSLAGIGAIGVSYGLARYGYGLFLPVWRREFDLSVQAVGVIASATYLAYLTALTLVGVLADRVGPRLLVVVAGASATAGLVMVALAHATWLLVAGLVLAGTSSGWAWAPFSDAIDLAVAPEQRWVVLALVPSGTAFGVVVAAAASAVTSASTWRMAWLGFAGIALVVTIVNAAVLPAGRRRSIGQDRPSGLCWLVRPGVVRLYATSLSYGFTGTVYWTYAVETVHAAGASISVALFWMLVGLSGTAGVFTGPFITSVGFAHSHTILVATQAAAIGLLGVAPDRPAAVVASALIYGVSFMAVSGLLATWSYKVFPERPSAGFSATVFALGVGAIIGPAAIGVIAEAIDLPSALVLTATLAGTTTLLRPGTPAGSPSGLGAP